MRTRWRRRWGGTEYVPRWELSLCTSWTSWLLGAEFEEHPTEWYLQIHLGPIALRLDHVR